MALGEIVVSLLAKTGSFDTDIDRSTKAAEKRMREMRKTIDQAGAAMGIAVAAGAATAVFATKQWINQLDALNDASDATGASIENLSALEDIALRTGTSMDAATGALVKFNAGLKGTDDDGKAGKALEAIGLNIDKLRQMDPAEALLQTALALAKFADDGDKARLVQELFGKSVREMAPLLKDLAEKGELVATVTTEQAKEAEAFNKELFAMQKNVTDLGRSFASDLVTGINAAAAAYRDSGLIAGLKMLFGGTEEFKANKRLSDLTDQYMTTQSRLEKARANQKGAGIFGFTYASSIAGLERDLQRINGELAPLLAARQSAPGMSLDALRASERGYRPSIGPVDTSKDKKTPKGPKGPDPDADFKAYLNQLEQQRQKLEELTASQKLLDDIRRGSLTVTPAQEKQLSTLAALVDKEKERKKVLEDTRDAFTAGVDAYTKGLEEERQRLDAMLQSGPAALLEKQRKDMLLLADAFGKGTISATEFNDAATGYLRLTGDGLTKNTELADGLAGAFTSATQSLASGGATASSFFEGLLRSISNLILQIGVLEPMAARIREAFGGKAGLGGGGFGGLIAGLLGGGGGGVTPPNPFVSSGGFSFGSLFGFADGGMPPVGRASLVGERGPELFIPRTAGMIVPNHALGGGGGKTTIVNQTQGRVDGVVEQQLSPRDRVLILQQARELVAADFHNANSPISRSLQRNYPLARKRS